MLTKTRESRLCKFCSLSRTACYYAGSLNDSGITVKECARYSGLKSLSANNTGSMRFETAVHDHGRRDRAEKRLRKSMSCGNDCGLRRGFIQNGGLFAGKKQPEFKMKK